MGSIDDNQEHTMWALGSYGAVRGNAEQELSIASLFSSTAYKYVPIADDEIRLLYVHSGRKEEEIRCDLLSYKRTENVVYKALSDCWGTDTASFKISIQEHTFYIRS
jgi:hypothetical protein